MLKCRQFLQKRCQKKHKTYKNEVFLMTCSKFFSFSKARFLWESPSILLDYQFNFEKKDEPIYQKQSFPPFKSSEDEKIGKSFSHVLSILIFCLKVTSLIFNFPLIFVQKISPLVLIFGLKNANPIFFIVFNYFSILFHFFIVCCIR